MEGQTDKWTDGMNLTDGEMDAWTDRWTMDDGWMNGQMDRLIDERMDGCFLGSGPKGDEVL